MLTTANVLLVGALFCVLMLLVLSSMLRSGVPGVGAWCVGSLLGGVALVLYAGGRVLPPFIGYEIANGVYAAATAAVLVGYRRFFGVPVPWAFLWAGVSLVMAAIALFHYVHDSFAMRTVTVALFQAAACAGIIATILRMRASWRSRYPYFFAITMAALVMLGHIVRSVIYLFQTSQITSLLQPSGWNLFFVSAGTFVLPVLTIGAVMMVHDAMMARAEYAANRDFLTGAWSRRAFVEMAGRELARAQRSGRRLCLLLIDVDHFKRINDTYGHAAGDQVLVEVVARAGTVVRSVDFIARVGGEEFGVLLPETEAEDGRQVAERLRRVLERTLTLDGGRVHGVQLHCTVSIGLAVMNDDEDLERLMRRADSALYEAKQGGRNRVVMAT